MSHPHHHISSQFGAILGFLGYVLTHVMQFVPKPVDFFPSLITAGCCAILGWCITKGMNKFSSWISKKFD